MNSPQTIVASGKDMTHLITGDIEYYLESKIRFATTLNQGDEIDWKKTLDLVENMRPPERLPIGKTIDNLRHRIRCDLVTKIFPEENTGAPLWRETLDGVTKTLRSLKTLLSLGENSQKRASPPGMSKHDISYETHVDWNGGRGCVAKMQDANDFFEKKFTNGDYKKMLEDKMMTARVFLADEGSKRFSMGYYFLKAIPTRPATHQGDHVPESLLLMDAGVEDDYVHRGVREYMALHLLDDMHTTRSFGVPSGIVNFPWTYTHIQDGLTPRLKS